MDAAQLKAKRQAAGLTQEDVASKLGWKGRQQVYDLETGKRKITSAVAVALKSILG